MGLRSCVSIAIALMYTTGGFAQQSEVTTISLLVQRLHAAYRARDVDGVLALWSEKSPQRAAQRQALRKLLEDSEVREITVRDPEVSGERYRVRVDREIGLHDGNRTRLVLEYVKEEGGWKIWKETQASEDLASRLAESATEQERADLLARNADLPAAEVATGLIDLGRGERNHGNFTKALRVYELARAIADRAEAGKVSATALSNIGLVQYDEGEYAQALETHKKSLAQSEALHDEAGMARSLNNIGVVYSDTGEFGLAWDALQKSLELGEKLRAAPLISNATGNLGILSGKRGDYIQALALLNKGVDLDVPRDDKRGLAIDYMDIGNVFLWQGDHAQSQQYFQRALDMAESAGLKPLVAYALMSLGQIAQFEGALDDAVRKYQKSLTLLTEVGDKAYLAKLLTFLGSVFSVQGEQDKALESLRRGLEIQEAIGAGAEMPLTLAQMAGLHNLKGDFQEALKASASARNLAEASGVREAMWRADLEQGKAFQGLGETLLAEAEFGKAIATIEELRVDVVGAESEHEGFFEDKLEPYHRMLDLLVASGRNAEAFQYAERAKARVLLDVFKNGRTQLSEVMSAEERERDWTLRLKLASLNAKLVGAGNSSPTQRAALTAEINRARLEFDDYETALYARHPQWKLRSGAVEPVSLNVALDMMHGGDTAFVEFAVTEKSVYVFAAGGGRSAQSKVFTAPVSRKELADRVERFRKQLADRDLGFRASAAALYKLLLEPAAEVLAGKRRLVLVPDGVLWEMPFPVLVNPADQYLLEKCAISYAPSLTALKAMIEVKRQRRQSPSQTALLAMGNPAFGGEARSRVRALYRDEQLGSLPLAEAEVQSLGRMYGETRSHVYIGREARESRFKREAGEPRVLHLATHGILNNASPLYSYLLLAQDTNGGPEDGLLEAHELLQMKLRAELVVLSACETARGRVSPGEGVIGLSWALLVAGAPTTVLSQWRVESESTSRLMLAFHQNRRKQMSDAEALREAALSISREPSFQHPFYWASFIVIGAGLD
jgi:CHAT domain-containing protein/Tfp pilus assembly protein PilF